MDTSSSQSLQQNPAPSQSQSQTTSSKNLKNWFDEFKAKVSKKTQQSQLPGGDATATSSEDVPKITKESQSDGQTKVKDPSLKQRKSTRISAAAELEHEAANIKTIFSQSNSRYESIPTAQRRRSLLSKIFRPLGWVIYYLIPFNYNLPWKLLSLINTSFVIIVIGLAIGSSESSGALSFVNGFVCGLAAAGISFIILTLSFIVHILPKSQDPDTSVDQHYKSEILEKTSLSTTELEVDSILGNLDASLDCTQLRPEDFSLLEVLEQEELDDSSPETTEKFDEENYKGWMIEFIGDYELRNSSDIKLKSIFVRIENRILYLCKTKNGPDADSSSLPIFTSQRVYDLNYVKKFSVYLLIPKNVRNKQKYVWSKKYPIKIEFQKEECNDPAEQKTTSGDPPKSIQLTLLAKSCREKEEWFRKFKRIMEADRLSTGCCAARSSFKSDVSLSNEVVGEGHLSSFKRFRCRSPSPRRDCVHTSQSSHFLGEQKKISDDENQIDDSKDPVQASGLARTKSCELLHPNRCSTRSSEASSEQEGLDGQNIMQSGPDDSTLTKETADLFSQNIDYSNILESQPTLNYKQFIDGLRESGRGASPTSDWFNALTGRIFFDVFSHDYWSNWFKRKIQRKLYRIRLPYFMETLTLTQIDLGTNAPQFFNVVSHSFDSFGLSIDFEMAYTGGLTMTFETKLNLLKIKSDNASTGSSSTNPNFSVSGGGTNNQQQNSLQPDDLNLQKDSSSTNVYSSETNKTKKSSKPSLSSSASTRTSCESTTSDSDDSDSDSSSESSFDEAELNEISDWEDYGAEKTRQNIVKFVDKIASSRYFQHATENRYIKKKLQDISNCPLVLVVKIQSLNGVLTLNVPPPQTDRIWYGFKPMPELELKAIPKMGDREVSLSHVTDWIERKLAEEFRKILVIPNMEDILLPVLKSDHMQYISATR